MEKVENDEVMSRKNIEKKKDTRRPIWNIAHQVNDKNDVNKRIDDGANGIEVDVSFNSDGTAYKMEHRCPTGANTDCWEETDFIEYLEYLRNLTSPGN